MKAGREGGGSEGMFDDFEFDAEVMRCMIYAVYNSFEGGGCEFISPSWAFFSLSVDNRVFFLVIRSRELFCLFGML